VTAPPWKPEPIDTFFMFGTGICEASWDPVRQAILDVDPRAPVEVNSKPEAGQAHWDEIRAANDASNFWFADLVHKRRRIQAIIAAPSQELERRTELRTTSEIEAFRERARVVGKELAKVDEDVKDAIVRRLKKAVATESRSSSSTAGINSVC